MHNEINDSSKLAISLLMFVFLAITAISLFVTARTKAIEASNKYQNIYSSLSDMETSPYDATSIHGSDIKTAMQLYAGDQFAVLVCNDGSGTYYNYGALVEGASITGTGTAQVAKVTVSSSDVTDGYYNLNLKYDTNGNTTSNSNLKPAKTQGNSLTFLRDSALYDSTLIKDDSGNVVGILEDISGN